MSSINLFTTFTLTIMHLIYPPPPLPPPPQKKLHDPCFQFLLGITFIPREIQDNSYAKYWGVNKVHYDLCENGECLNYR